MFKLCRTCGIEKPFEEFNKAANGLHGLKGTCIECRTKKRAEESIRVNARRRELRTINPEHHRAVRKAHYKNNSAKIILDVSNKKAKKLLARPIWADEEELEYIYNLAQIKTKETGIPYEVDHIVPLVSNFVCGFHSQENLRIIPRTLNRRKKNYYWSDMPVVI